MTTNTEPEHRNFLGIPVIGEITRDSSTDVAQRPLSDLEPMICALLADSQIYAFGWEQYTPYFNDGEPCTFRICEPWFLTVADVVELLKEAGMPTQKAPAFVQAREVLLRANLDPDLVKVPESELEPEPEAEPVVVDAANLPGFDRLPDFDKYEYTAGYGAHPSMGQSGESYSNAKAFARALDSGAFNDVMLEAFGDHCRVIVQRDTIKVDSYEHD